MDIPSIMILGTLVGTLWFLDVESTGEVEEDRKAVPTPPCPKG